MWTMFSVLRVVAISVVLLALSAAVVYGLGSVSLSGIHAIEMQPGNFRSLVNDFVFAYGGNAFLFGAVALVTLTAGAFFLVCLLFVLAALATGVLHIAAFAFPNSAISRAAARA